MEFPRLGTRRKERRRRVTMPREVGERKDTMPEKIRGQRCIATIAVERELGI